MPTEGSPPWKRILRRIGQVVCGLAAVVILLILTVIAINAVDDDLTPAAKAMLTPPPNPYPDKDNLYVALMGFDAPADQTPLQLGAARIQYYNDTIDARLRHPDFGNDGPLAAFMQQHPELSRHPIDNQPFEWDAKSGTISVKTVGPRPKERRFSVKVTS